jgi:mycofactocin precursor
MTVTTTQETTPLPTDGTAVPNPVTAPEGLVESDLLVEDVSIDGMCGVY